jgi:hypothetical protein
MSVPLPSWLQISPKDYLNAMEAGSQAGLERNRLALSAQQGLQRNQLDQASQQQQAQEAAARLALARRAQQQQGEEFSAGQSLQRDKLLAETAQAQQQQSAAAALKEAQMQQQAMLAGNSLDAQKQRNDDLATYQQGLLQNKNDLLDLKSNSTKMAPQDQEKLKYLYGELTSISKAASAEVDPDKRLALVGTLNSIKKQINALSAPAAAPAPIAPAQPAAASLKSSYTTPAGTFGMDGKPLNKQPLPLPKSKDELETGQLYQTARGQAVWDGQKFHLQSDGADLPDLTGVPAQ